MMTGKDMSVEIKSNQIIFSIWVNLGMQIILNDTILSIIQWDLSKICDNWKTDFRTEQLVFQCPPKEIKKKKELL